MTQKSTDPALQIVEARRREMAIEHLLFGTIRFVAQQHPALLAQHLAAAGSWRKRAPAEESWRKRTPAEEGVVSSPRTSSTKPLELNHPENRMESQSKSANR